MTARLSSLLAANTRRQQYQRLYGRFGIGLPHAQICSRDEAAFSMMELAPNFEELLHEHAIIPGCQLDVDTSIVKFWMPNFVLRIMHPLQPVLKAFEPFSDSFRDQYGVAIIDYLAGVSYTSGVALRFLNRASTGLLLMCSGMLLVKKSDLFEWFSNVQNVTNFGNEISTKSYPNLLAMLSYPTDTSLIDLSRRKPQQLIYPVSETLILIDALATRLCVETHALPFITSFVDRKGQKRAQAFNEYVQHRMLSEVNGAKEWVPVNTDVFDGSNKREDKKPRNVDASFILGNILFICETKAINTAKYDAPMLTETIVARWDTRIAELTRVDWLARRIASNNCLHQIPAEVDWVLPLIVTLAANQFVAPMMRIGWFLRRLQEYAWSMN